MKYRRITPLVPEKAGVPKAGTTGQVLTKLTNDNFDTTWTTAASGGGANRGIVFGRGRDGGITTGKLKGYFTVDYDGTIIGWSLSTKEVGTLTVKFWKRADGTVSPIAADSINTSGVSLAVGTHIRSANVSDFTTTVVTEGDIFAVEITALTGTITDFAGTLEITPA